VAPICVRPLEQCYSSIIKFKQFRDPSVGYIAARAEDIPACGIPSDLVLMDNVLDHCDDIPRVLAQVRGALVDHGFVYIRVNTLTGGYLIRHLLERFQIDQGHPVTFTKRSLLRELEANGFRLLRFGEQRSFSLWCAQLRSGKPENRWSPP